MAAPVHGDEPPSRFIYRASHSQQPMISQDSCLVIPERFRNSLPFARLVHDPSKIVKYDVVLKERARILRNGI